MAKKDCINKRLAKSLVKWRRKHGVTQGDVAKTIGISRSAIAMFETKQRDVVFATGIKLAKLIDFKIVL